MRFGCQVTFEAVGISTLLFAHLTKKLEFLKAFRLDAIADRLGSEKAFAHRDGGTRLAQCGVASVAAEPAE